MPPSSPQSIHRCWYSLAVQLAPVALLLALATPASAQRVELTLDPASGTARSITADGFDFAPSDRHAKRAGDGFFHTGDLRYAVPGADGAWRWFSTAARRTEGRGLPLADGEIAAEDISASAGPDAPLRIVRRWSRDGDDLVLRWELTNPTDAPIELGGLGLPLSFNNLLTDRTLAEVHTTCSFADPYVGLDAGYVQVTRLQGAGPALVVMPEGRTPFAAWQTLSEPMPLSQTFEGTYEWLVHTRALAETDWQAARPWNEPSSQTLAPGQTHRFGLRLVAVSGIRHIERTLRARGQPLVVGVPGYVLPQGQDGTLFVGHAAALREVSVEPAGALDIERVPHATPGWERLRLRAQGFGRARLTLVYADGLRQTVHYHRTLPAAQVVDRLGQFLYSKQWFESADDPFGRSPSIISYDREANAPVLQDVRVWIAGLGDEAGSGSWLAAALKQQVLPERGEVAKFERFVDGVLWGGLQLKDGPDRHGVRKSLFFHDPTGLPQVTYRADLDWSTWASWKPQEARSVGRAYNYPHVVAAYLAMYRVARHTRALAQRHPWDWYLRQAVDTTRFAFSRKPDGARRVAYADMGLMAGTVFGELLDELQREGWQDEARAVDALLRERADAWSRQAYPFGSEMAWDSTGQEEVYGLSRRYGHDAQALVALNAVLGYMPTVPHWGWNGNARRYWDFLYGGKLQRIERQIHHYGSGLNAIPVLAHFRAHPDDFHLLRVGHGGTMGALSNIDEQGFASAAFHANPDTLKWDAYSGDYGPNFYGHAYNAGTYIVDHPAFGWLAFGGNLRETADRVEVTPLDALRRRVFIAPLGLWLTLDAGRFEKLTLDRRNGRVRLLLSRSADEPRALLRMEHTTHSATRYELRGRQARWRDSLIVPAGRVFELVPR